MVNSARRGKSRAANPQVGLFAAVCAALAFSLGARDLYWVGGTATNNMNVATSWTYADGTIAESKPGSDDTLIFTNSVLRATMPSQTQYGQIVLRGTAPSLSVRTSSGTFYMPVRGLRDESTSGSITTYRVYSRPIPTGCTVCTNIVEMVNGGGRILESSHGYLGDTKSANPSNYVIAIRGKGTYRPVCDSTGNFPSSTAIYLMEGGTNCLPYASADKYSCYYKSVFRFHGACGQVLRLGLHNNQYFYFRDLQEEDVGHDHALHTASTGTRLCFTGEVQNVTYSGRVLGNLSVLWQPDNDAKLTLNGATWGSTGNLYVMTGTVAVTAGTHFKQATVDVRSGATLELHDTAAGWFNANLSVAEGGKVKLVGNGSSADGRRFSFAKIKVGDADYVTSGVYTAANCSWIEGDGVVFAGGDLPEPETTTATWTGGGDDDFITNPANWGAATAQELPDLVSGSLVATFPANAKVRIPSTGSHWLKGIVAGGALDLAAEAGAPRLWLGSAGLVQNAAGSITNAAPLLLVAAQTWQLMDSLVFTASGTLASASPSAGFTLTRDNASKGKYYTFLGDNSRLASLNAYGMVHPCADNALGGEETVVKLYGYAATADSDGRLGHVLLLDTPTTQAAMITVAYLNNSTGNRFCISKVKTVFTSPFKFDIANNVYGFAVGTTDDSWLDFRAGLTHPGANRGCAFTPQAASCGKISVSGAIASFRKMKLSNMELNLDVADCLFDRGIHFLSDSARLCTSVDNVFAERSGLDSKKITRTSGVNFTADGVWDLCGTSQQVQMLEGSDGSGKGRIMSSRPATFTLKSNVVYGWDDYYDESPVFSTNDTTRLRNSVVFSGDVSLVKNGPLTNYFGGASTSTGSITVNEGQLAFFGSGSWTNAPRVTVNGGSLKLATGKEFAKTVAVSIDAENGGAIEIPSGMRLRCATLTVSGEPVRSHVYTGAGVTGGGTILVGKGGLIVFVR